MRIEDYFKFEFKEAGVDLEELKIEAGDKAAEDFIVFTASPLGILRFTQANGHIFVDIYDKKEKGYVEAIEDHPAVLNVYNDTNWDVSDLLTALMIRA